jgi:hypothetical protein
MTTEPDAKTRVLDIGGWGRCGSTLLDMMLGQLEGFVSAGEVRELWLRGCAEDRPCGCGAPFSACDFWSSVGQEAFGGWDRLDLATLLRVRYRRDRAWSLPARLWDHRRAALDDELGRYVEALQRLIGAIAAVAGARVVIDSSKLPTHTLLLQQAGRLDVRVVHLVRDSRGVAHSVRKQVTKSASRGADTLLPRHGSVTSSLRYDLYNGAHHVLEARESRAGRTLLRVRYEDLVEDPRRWLRDVATHAGEPLPVEMPFLDETGSQVCFAPNHLVDGNPVRFSHGWVPLRLDTAWRTDLAARERRAVTALTLPLLARYGYPLSVGAGPGARRATSAEVVPG